MDDEQKSEHQQPESLEAMRRRINELEAQVEEYKRIEEALRESEQKLREAQRMAHIGNWWWDVHSGEVEWSEEVYNIFGLDPETFTPQIDSIQALSPWPEDHARDQELIQRATESRESGSYEQRFLLPDGSTGYYFSTFQGIYTDEGELVAMQGTVQDITARKRAEQQQLALVREKERHDTLRTLIGNISHDIKTPLTIINTSTYLLEKYADIDEQKRQDKIDTIKGQVQVLERLFQDLILLTRLDSAEEMKLSSVDVNELGLGIETEFQPIFQKQGTVFALDLDREMTPIQANRDDIRRAMMNLVANALQYTKDAGIVTLRTYSKNEHVVIEIEDSGIGISADDLPYIFDRFYRASQAQTMVAKGSGLGLAIVKRIIENHGGEINVQSTPNMGSTFRVMLPTQR